jgi:hypothetical protein
MRAKNIGPNYEITVDGRPRSDRVLRHVAVQSAQYLMTAPEIKGPDA